MLMRSNNFFKIIIFIFYLLYLVLGLLIYKDFGITTDEEFQRYSGFYWLQYILNFTPFENLKLVVEGKLLEISSFTLPNPKDFPFYGVIFDLPLAFYESLFQINDSQNYFYLRHKVNFLLFFISSIYVYKILRNRFNENFLTIVGILLYITSPRIFGDSFFNNKDIVFLSLITISIYYCFKVIDNFNYKNIFLFSLIAAIATSARIIGVFLPISLILIKLFGELDKKFDLNFLTKILIFLFLYFLFLTILWPYLWDDPLTNFLKAFSIFSNYIIDIKFLFDGSYVSSKKLPLLYIPTWIIISTPVFTIICFIIGYSFCFRRILLNVLNIEKKKDIWINKEEEKDFYIFANFTLIVAYLIFSNTVLYNGWRQVYFLHFFIVYFAFFGIKYCFIYLTVLRNLKGYVVLVYLLIILLPIFQIYKLHPFQSFYFNSLISKKNIHNYYEVDYWGLSGRNFLEKLIKINNDKEKIKVAVASWIPLNRSLSILNYENKEKIEIFGQNYHEANYIFLNNTSEVNKYYNKKYEIPKNYEKIEELIIGKILVYEIFKKKINNSP